MEQKSESAAAGVRNRQLLDVEASGPCFSPTSFSSSSSSSSSPAVVPSLASVHPPLDPPGRLRSRTKDQEPGPGLKPTPRTCVLHHAPRHTRRRYLLTPRGRDCNWAAANNEMDGLHEANADPKTQPASGPCSAPTELRAVSHLEDGRPRTIAARGASISPRAFAPPRASSLVRLYRLVGAGKRKTGPSPPPLPGESVASLAPV
ncbi:hypothetical protein CDD83_8189 [Cordyceps sp. RAO-2017]|nr:hypothetical protein CDD83_8189 [Cordyceps sp. RAO-2017]